MLIYEFEIQSPSHLQQFKKWVSSRNQTETLSHRCGSRSASKTGCCTAERWRHTHPPLPVWHSTVHHPDPACCLVRHHAPHSDLRQAQHCTHVHTRHLRLPGCDGSSMVGKLEAVAPTSDVGAWVLTLQ